MDAFARFSAAPDPFHANVGHRGDHGEAPREAELDHAGEELVGGLGDAAGSLGAIAAEIEDEAAAFPYGGTGRRTRLSGQYRLSSELLALRFILEFYAA